MRNRFGLTLAVLAVFAFVFSVGVIGCAHGSKDASGAKCCTDKGGACASCSCEACKTMCASGKTGWCDTCKHGCMNGKTVTCKPCYDKGGTCSVCAAATKK